MMKLVKEKDNNIKLLQKSIQSTNEKMQSEIVSAIQHAV